MRFFLNTNLYIAIIGDIVRSKNIKERNQVQKVLEKTLNDINKKFKDNISAKFMITLGDEFQGLLNSGTDVITIIEYIERKMYPVRLRFGIGIGEISTVINPDIPYGADGPAYYNARNMIESLKQRERRKKSFAANIMIMIDSADNTAALLNSIFSLYTLIKQRWTTRQREVIYNCMEYGDNQIITAKRLGITQSSVQKNLSNSGYYTYKNTMETISKVLSEIRKV